MSKKYDLGQILPFVDVHDIRVLIDALEMYHAKEREQGKIFTGAHAMLEELKCQFDVKRIFADEKFKE